MIVEMCDQRHAGQNLSKVRLRAIEKALLSFIFVNVAFL